MRMAEPTSPISIRSRGWKVEELAAHKREGKLFLPDLQRGFVWSADRVKMLFDSLSRGYPVGALLLWKWTPAEIAAPVPLETRPWDLNMSGGTEKAEPKPNGLYLLDGQQRLTSLFRVLFSSHSKKKSKPDPDLWVSLASGEKWAADRFHLYSRELQSQLRDGLLVPAPVLFARVRGEDENKSVRVALKDWLDPSSDEFYSALDVANQVRDAVLKAEILAYEIDADIDRNEDVIEIFVRLNRQGVPLTPGDLAAARLTGKMTQFRDKAAKTLSEPGFEKFSLVSGDDAERKGGFVDADLLIRTALFLGTGFIKYSEAEKKKPKKAEAEFEVYDKVEPEWPRAQSGLVQAVTSLRNMGVPDGSWLSSRFLLLPIAVAAAREQEFGLDFWRAWLVAATLWGHYSKAGETRAQSDARAAAAGDRDALIESLKHTAKRNLLSPTGEELGEGNVSEDGVMLSLLLTLYKNQARSFPSGQLFTSLSQSVEIHHIFPKDLFRKIKQDSDLTPGRIGNLTPLFRPDNNALSKRPPATYLPEIQEAYRSEHLIPSDSALWGLGTFESFCAAREQEIAKAIRELLLKGGLPVSETV